MSIVLCCQNILLDLVAKPGWDGDDKDIEQRIRILERLLNLIDTGKIKLYVPQELIPIIHIIVKENIDINNAQQVVQKILSIATTNLCVDYENILEQSNNLDFYPENTELYQATSLIIAKELKADAFLSSSPYDLRKIVDSNSRYFSDFNVPILNLDSFEHLLNEGVFDQIVQDEIEVIYAFTPNGRVVRLPRGATPIDFAYAVHTEIGNRCLKALVGGEDHPLDQPLLNGDIVEIIKGSKHEPNPEWLNFVVTRLAQKSIQRTLRRKDQEQGWVIIKQKLGESVKTYKKKLEYAAKKLDCGTLDKLALKIGSGELSIKKVRTLIQKYNSDINNHCSKATCSNNLFKEIGDRNFVIGSCCNPLPNQKVIGLLRSSERPIRVHSIDCPNIQNNKKPNEKISLTWNCDRVKIQLKVTLLDEPGTLLSILNELENNSIITDVRQIKPNKKGNSLAFLEFTLNCNQNGKRISKLIENMPSVQHISVTNIVPVIEKPKPKVNRGYKTQQVLQKLERTLKH